MKPVYPAWIVAFKFTGTAGGMLAGPNTVMGA
jgi:hypothetical protein